MRKTIRKTSTALTILINLLMNLEWLIPSVILLVLHFTLGISVWWAALGLLLWIIPTVLFSCCITWATADGEFPRPATVNVKLRENERNPFEKEMSEVKDDADTED